MELSLATDNYHAHERIFIENECKLRYNKFYTDESPSFLNSYISIHLCVSLM